MLRKLARRARAMVKRCAARVSADPADCKTALEVRRRGMTYLPETRLLSIASFCRELDRNGVEGAFLEAGCALGGSSVVISKAKAKERPFRVYDVFEMIPPPTEEDGPDVHERYRVISEGKARGIDGDEYYGYREDLYQHVQENLNAFGVAPKEENVELIKGLVQETLVVDAPVAFAHIDVDWYEPVTTCLERIIPQLQSGGVIVLDDYHDWSGCHRATDDYFAERQAEFQFFDRAGARIIRRP